MRKIIAVLFMIVVVLPVLVAAMSLTAMRVSITHSEADMILLVLAGAGVAGLAVLTWIAADNSRERAAWAGSALLVPALLILAMSFAINSDLVTGIIRYGVQQTHYYGTLYSQLTTATTEAPALRTIAGGFSDMGIIAAALAVMMFILSTVLPQDDPTEYCEG